MSQSTGVEKQMLPRRFKILLGVSLALNLAVIGVMAGAAFRKGPDKGPRGGGQASYARPYIQALPQEDRRAIFEASRPSKGKADRAAGRAARRALYQEVTDILRAETFERAAVEAVLLKQTGLTLDRQGAMQIQWLNRIADMDVEERRSYADAVDEALKRGPARKRKPSSD